MKVSHLDKKCIPYVALSQISEGQIYFSLEIEKSSSEKLKNIVEACKHLPYITLCRKLTIWWTYFSSTVQLIHNSNYVPSD